jgi:Lrp/AsnC family leucine-responsive transcriptional regulator
MSTKQPGHPGDFDPFDIAILSALAVEPRLSAVELSEIVHLSRTAVAKRILSLRDRGAFAENANTLSYSALGFDILAIIEVSVRSGGLDSAKKLILEMPEVLTATVVSGDNSLILDVVAVDMLHFRQFVRGLQDFGITSTKLKFSTEHSRLSLAKRLNEIQKNRQSSD